MSLKHVYNKSPLAGYEVDARVSTVSTSTSYASVNLGIATLPAWPLLEYA